MSIWTENLLFAVLPPNPSPNLTLALTLTLMQHLLFVALCTLLCIRDFDGELGYSVIRHLWHRPKESKQLGAHAIPSTLWRVLWAPTIHRPPTKLLLCAAQARIVVGTRTFAADGGCIQSAACNKHT